MVVITPQNGAFNNLSEDFIREFQDKVNWYGCDNPSKWGLQQQGQR